MEIKIKSNIKYKKVFEPFTIEIKIESLEDARNLLSQQNASHNDQHDFARGHEVYFEGLEKLSDEKYGYYIWSSEIYHGIVDELRNQNIKTITKWFK